MKTYSSMFRVGLALASMIAIGSSTVADAAPVARPGGPPRSTGERQPRARPTTPSGAQKRAEAPERFELLRKASAKDGVTKYTCPARLDIASGSTIASGSLAFVSARADAGTCSSWLDFAPADKRGGSCMTCTYEHGVSIQRSGGKQNVCWVVPDAPDSLACEYTPPPPASQTCAFQIKPPTTDLFPLEHVSGDKEMWSEGNVFDAGSPAIVNVDASLERGTGGNSGKLRLWVHARLRESAPDHTTFSKTKTVWLGDEHIVNGTAADVAACFATYGEQHPFAPITGHAGIATIGNDWTNLARDQSGGRLLFDARCKLDSKGDDDGDVGCDPITFDELTVSVR